MKITESIEFVSDDGTWAMQVEGSVEELTGVEHVWVNVKQDERPLTLVDLDVSNARRVAALLNRVADAVEASADA